MSVVIISNQVNKKKINWLRQLLIILLCSTLFLAPYGIRMNEEIIWLTDFASIFVFIIIVTIFISGRMGIRKDQFRLSLGLFFLFLFFLFEFLFPVIGVIVWNDFSSADSSFRALIYWAPLLMILILRSFNGEEVLKFFDKVIFVAVVLNLIVGFMELAIYFEVISDAFNFRLYLFDFAPQDRFLNNRVMSFGFFQNSTAFGIFGFISFIHFLSRVLQTDSNKFKFYLYALFSLIIIILSTSRVPLISAFISFFIFLLFLRRTKWNLIFSSMLFIFSSVVLVFLFSSDYMLFSRFSRLLEGELSEDYSLGQRLFIHWPKALDFYSELGHPTFTNPTRYIGTIDSGYLTYLLQGGWWMVFSLISLLLVLILSSLKRILEHKERSYFSYFLLFLCVYIALGLVISNPMRNPLVIYFLCYAVFGLSFRKALKG